MSTDPLPPWTADEIAANLLRLSPAYAPTPLHDLPALARRLGIAGLLAKDEGCRALGSFKSLGGTYAGLRALMRATGTDLACLLDPARRPARLPALHCASAGNHGLAVAAAARCAGAWPHLPRGRAGGACAQDRGRRCRHRDRRHPGRCRGGRGHDRAQR
ncbi:MAG: pyridoxal-phosphate dependent enzyme [Geminicoccaceae bacterium]